MSLDPRSAEAYEACIAMSREILTLLEDRPFYGPWRKGEWVPDSVCSQIEHLEGVEWLNAVAPPRLHRCTAQTRGTSGTGAFVERCACGSIRLDGGHWAERNRRKIASRQGSSPGPLDPS